MSRARWLFICARNPDTTHVLGGGEAFTASNLTALRSCADVEVFNVLSWEGFLERVLRFLFLSLNYTSSLYPWKVWRLKQLLRVKDFEGVFIDQSFYGRLARDLKNDFPHLKVITQFHNVESIAALSNLPVPMWLRRKVSRVAFWNEGLAVKFSDQTLFLTDEDFKDVSELCGTPQGHHILPLILPPKKGQVDSEKSVIQLGQKPYLLFCGSYFPPNIQGLSWFIEKVLPHIPYDLHIVGFDMEKFKSSHERIKNWGTVTDLLPHYQNALAVVAPLFAPGGMKTKTVEALSYGKKLFATEYALLGISREICQPLVGAEDFISAINQADFSTETPVLGEEFTFEYKKRVFAEIFRGPHGSKS